MLVTIYTGIYGNLVNRNDSFKAPILVVGRSYMSLSTRPVGANMEGP